MKNNIQFLTAVADMLEAMKVMGNEEEMRYKTTETEKVEFPTIKVKFKGRLWTVQKARDQYLPQHHWYRKRWN